ncbi:hypothetical protein ACP4OV_028535 [Aristida adscensionis]
MASVVGESSCMWTLEAAATGSGKVVMGAAKGVEAAPASMASVKSLGIRGRSSGVFSCSGSSTMVQVIWLTMVVKLFLCKTLPIRQKLLVAILTLVNHLLSFGFGLIIQMFQGKIIWEFLIKWLKESFFPHDQLVMPWIKYDAPSPISIPEYVLRSIFSDNGCFNIDVVDAIMLLYVKFDDWMYDFFFCVMMSMRTVGVIFLGIGLRYVLHGFGNLESDVIRSFLLGDHITYDVEHCQMSSGKEMELLFLGFYDSSMMSSADKVKAIHGNLVYKLHAALFSYKKKFFRGWDCDEDGCTSSFPTHISVHTGTLEFMLFMQELLMDRQQLNFQLAGPMQSKVYEFRFELLYVLLSMDGNQGYKHPHLN